ncbi:hypothetical protein NN3_63190 [Nocardia neocaledoniensis NBRC 108232]|uniref:Uncharacterized protein DUF202 n=2 Tax=Nocardia neocaledoniensis TaxID=236511 RepID=A0A317N5P9_9NOCA|nr:DUF202 domain-containing protein [Nocardia neocaledoniensis]PWV70404.1 uncharacterized protein DUF202 [Nocardia neocaledoniensis]GEM35312.1 hypothetical protein NN3_63190 [Nocardia neocaledoniensis NBRC 108232]
MTAPPGLQPERTVLAWRRTALAATVLTVLLVRAVVTSDAPAAPLALGCAAATLAAILAAARERHRRYRADLVAAAPLPTASAVAICAGTAMTAGAALPLLG